MTPFGNLGRSSTPAATLPEEGFPGARKVAAQCVGLRRAQQPIDCLDCAEAAVAAANNFGDERARQRIVLLRAAPTVLALALAPATPVVASVITPMVASIVAPLVAPVVAA
eukprot:3022757-Pleurochrysis_carterae.AAC.1